MRGWLVYERANVARNERYIGKWMAQATARGVSLELITTDDIAWGVRGDKPFLQASSPLPDFAVMRAPIPLLTKHFERLGVRAFNDSRVSEIANDKRKTHAELCELVPMMDTAFVSPGAFQCPFPYPVVVKAARGCGGRQVFMASDDRQYQAALDSIAPDDAVVQPVCDTPGKDLRVYMLGKRIVAPMLRESHDDFKSNLGLGGGARRVDLPEEIERMARAIAERFDFGLVGVDFIFHKGKPVFNEIEDAVGARMLYMYTDIDIVKEYFDLIEARL